MMNANGNSIPIAAVAELIKFLTIKILFFLSLLITIYSRHNTKYGIVEIENLVNRKRAQ